MCVNACRGALLGLFFGCSAALAADLSPAYHIVDLGPASGFIDGARGINDVGQVAVGSGIGQSTASIWSGGSLQGLPNSVGAIPRGINVHGDVVGMPGNNSASAWISGSALSLEAITGLNRATGVDINDSRQIAVAYLLAGSRAGQAYDYNTGVLTPLGSLGGTRVIPEGITQTGLVVGHAQQAGGRSRAVMWTNGVVSELAPGAFAGNSTYAIDMNEAGVAVGGIDLVGPCMFTEGTIVQLATVAQSDLVSASAINDDGVIVGFRRRTAGGFRALAWDSAGVHDLGSLLTFQGAGWVLESANGINESGWISGFGTLGGQNRSFVMIPVPAPASGVIVVAGLFVRRARRRA